MVKYPQVRLHLSRLVPLPLLLLLLPLASLAFRLEHSFSFSSSKKKDASRGFTRMEMAETASGERATAVSREPLFQGIQGIRRALLPVTRESWEAPFLNYTSDSPGSGEIERNWAYLNRERKVPEYVRRYDLQTFLDRRFVNQRINDLKLLRQQLRLCNEAGEVPPWVLALKGVVKVPGRRDSDRWGAEWGQVFSGLSRVLAAENCTVDTVISALRAEKVELTVRVMKEEEGLGTSVREEIMKKADASLVSQLQELRKIRADLSTLHLPPVRHSQTSKWYRWGYLRWVTHWTSLKKIEKRLIQGFGALPPFPSPSGEGQKDPKFKGNFTDDSTPLVPTRVLTLGSGFEQKPPQQQSFWKILRTLYRAAHDDTIAAVVLDGLPSCVSTLPQVEEFGRHIALLRRCGKKVYGFERGGINEKEHPFMCIHCDQIFFSADNAGLLWGGDARVRTYRNSTYDKFGVKYHRLATDTYKTAGEENVRDEPTASANDTHHYISDRIFQEKVDLWLRAFPNKTQEDFMSLLKEAPVDLRELNQKGFLNPQGSLDHLEEAIATPEQLREKIDRRFLFQTSEFLPSLFPDSSEEAEEDSDKSILPTWSPFLSDTRDANEWESELQVTQPISLESIRQDAMSEEDPTNPRSPLPMHPTEPLPSPTDVKHTNPAANLRSKKAWRSPRDPPPPTSRFSSLFRRRSPGQGRKLHQGFVELRWQTLDSYSSEEDEMEKWEFEQIEEWEGNQTTKGWFQKLWRGKGEKKGNETSNATSVSEEKVAFANISAALSQKGGKGSDGKGEGKGKEEGTERGLEMRTRSPALLPIESDPDQFEFLAEPKKKKAQLAALVKKETVALIDVSGPIGVSSSPFGGGGTAGDFDANLMKAREDPNTRAIVLYLDTPGGSADACERHAALIRETRRDYGIPVVCVMGQVCASAGMQMASQCDMIFLSNSTITGSIGVVGALPTFGGVSDWLRQKRYETKWGGRVAPFDSQRSPTDEEFEWLQKLFNQSYDQFVTAVGRGRRLSAEQVFYIAGGRVWWGDDGLRLSLGDFQGGLVDGVRAAAVLGKMAVTNVTGLSFSPLPRVKEIRASANDFLASLLLDSDDDDEVGGILRRVLLRARDRFLFGRSRHHLPLWRLLQLIRGGGGEERVRGPLWESIMSLEGETGSTLTAREWKEVIVLLERVLSQEHGREGSGGFLPSTMMIDEELLQVYEEFHGRSPYTWW
uniref:Peptidase S49 domain-containing protein n=1 Tax=Chromera velia CCMP2878 TaxID=1169474 RepID=A0A0G4I726_9ALVE|eukprot:Cvel_11559.t1-p1 / transcript=Cvel_11559.t1 / gene=Cvel_11559 / organism=Chromera_velia_CCMP2878 / gene_product=Putative signal peptide peptidase SppA, putative / transcript_product=Putative signal peptide peptidase SppA, putative / location=Cvel_scaffold730:38232-43428(+) / protein_length=1214 / sequence_SO=supercontig / SO=protein_coding / is_pseudo=false